MASRLVLLVFLALVAFRAEALSCSAMEARYYLVCTKEACEPAFQVVPEHSYGGACSRHTVVSEIEPALARYVAQLALAARAPEGLVSLRFGFRWWKYESAGTYVGFERNLLESYWYGERGGLPDLQVDEVVRTLDKSTGRRWLRPEAAVLAEARRMAETEAAWERLQNLARAGTCWGFILALLLGLAYAARVFSHSLTMPPGGARKRRIAFSLTAQVGTMLGTGFVFFASFALLFCAHLALVPLSAFFILLIEAGLAIRMRRAARSRLS